MSSRPEPGDGAASRRVGWRTAFRARPPVALGIVVASLIDSTGNGLFLAGSVLYFTLGVGLSDTQVGLGLSIAGLVGFVTTLPVSALGDRIGSKRLLVGLQLWRFVGFSGYAFVHSFPTFLACTCFIACGDRVSRPVTQAMVGEAVDEKQRVSTMAFIRAIRNGGLTLGVLLAAAAIALGTQGYRVIMLADGVSFLVAGVVLWRVRLPPRAAVVSPPGTQRRFGAVNLRYLLFTALSGFLALNSSVLWIAIPLWVVQHTHVDRVWVSPLIALNTVLVVLLQVKASHQATDLASASRTVLRAGLLLGLACVLLLIAPWPGSEVLELVVLTGGVVVLTLGELLSSTGSWAISYELSPPYRRSAYLGVFSLGATGQQVVGPMIITGAVLALGSAGWLGLAAVFVTAGLLTAWAGRPRTPPADVGVSDGQAA